MTTETSQEAAPVAVTPATLTEALTEFWLTVRGGSRQHRGQVAAPEEAAVVLYARLAGIAAETAAMPQWVLDTLDDRVNRNLIESWRPVPGRGIVVIGAGAEVELGSEHDAGLFLAGLSSALTAFHDGQARR